MRDAIRALKFAKFAGAHSSLSFGEQPTEQGRNTFRET
jgi:hypothetical protein